MLGAFDIGCTRSANVKGSIASNPDVGAGTTYIGVLFLGFIMISLVIWNSISGRERSIWLEENCPVSAKGRPRNATLVVGVNDATYLPRKVIGGIMVSDPAYSAWRGMMQRVYDACQQIRRPTYIGVTVCDEWHKFSAFRIWWLKHQVDGYQLDKDLLSDAGEYSPNACLFVPQWLNSFTTDSGAARGKHPIGVHFHNDKELFQARCKNPITGAREHLGYFSTPEAAHLAWRTRKLELALELKPKMDEIDLRIYPRIVEIINDAR